MTSLVKLTSLRNVQRHYRMTGLHIQSCVDSTLDPRGSSLVEGEHLRRRIDSSYSHTCDRCQHIWTLRIHRQLKFEVEGLNK